MNTTDIQIQLRSAERNLWAVLATIVFSLLACAAANAQTQEGWSKLKGDVNHKVDADKAAGEKLLPYFFYGLSKPDHVAIAIKDYSLQTYIKSIP